MKSLKEEKEKGVYLRIYDEVNKRVRDGKVSIKEFMDLTLFINKAQFN